MRLSWWQLHELARLSDPYGWGDKSHLDVVALRKHRDGDVTVRITRAGKLRKRIVLPWRGNGTVEFDALDTEPPRGDS